VAAAEVYRSGTLGLPQHSYVMRNFYLTYGVAALVGTLLLFIAWHADRERQAGIERLETAHTSGQAR
jgi:hypothetical protein